MAAAAGAASVPWELNEDDFYDLDDCDDRAAPPAAAPAADAADPPAEAVEAVAAVPQPQARAFPLYGGSDGMFFCYASYGATMLDVRERLDSKVYPRAAALRCFGLGALSPVVRERKYPPSSGGGAEGAACGYGMAKFAVQCQVQ